MTVDATVTGQGSRVIWINPGGGGEKLGSEQ